MSHTHWDGGPACRFKTKRECEENFANWQADQQVALAAKVAQRPEAVRAYRKAKDVFGQLVLVMLGEQSTIDGEAPFTRRVRAALDRYRASTPAQ